MEDRERRVRRRLIMVRCRWQCPGQRGGGEGERGAGAGNSRWGQQEGRSASSPLSPAIYPPLLLVLHNNQSGPIMLRPNMKKKSSLEILTIFTSCDSLAHKNSRSGWKLAWTFKNTSKLFSSNNFAPSNELLYTEVCSQKERNLQSCCQKMRE